MAKKVVVSSAVAIFLVVTALVGFLYYEARVAPSVGPNDSPEEIVSEVAPVAELVTQNKEVRVGDFQADYAIDSRRPEGERQLLSSGGWKTRGRIVRHLEPDGDHNDIDFNGPKEPVAGAVVLMDSHPDSMAKMRLAVQRRVTGADGRFAFGGVPGGDERFRLSIDVPGYAYRAMSFHFDDPPLANDKLDFGDIVVYSGAALQFRLVGPEEEPITGATVKIAPKSSNPRRGWVRAKETWRVATEVGNGGYVLERAICGNMKVRAWAPG